MVILKHDLDEGHRHHQQGWDRLHLGMGHVLMLPGVLVGPHGMDHIVHVIGLHCRCGKPVQHILTLRTDGLRQLHGFQIAFRFEIVQRAAVAHNGRCVHGHLLRKHPESGQRPACGYGKAAAVVHEIAEGFHIPL